MNGKRYDVIVVGGGSGGSAFCKRAAGYGARVAIIDRGVKYVDGVRVGAGAGGTCVNVGCVPKKLMFNAAAVKEAISPETGVAEGYGWTIPMDSVSFNWAGLKKKRDAYVQRLSDGYVNGWKKAGVDVYGGAARFADRGNGETPSIKTIEIENDGSLEVLEADRVVIACGGKPSLPPIPGTELCITSDGFFDLEVQPKKVAVVGAGYIAVEMAGILHALGSETHLFFRGATVLRHGFDPFVVTQLMEAMRSHGPALHANSTPASVSAAPDGTKTLTLADGSEFGGFDVVLMATGRDPLGSSLNLPASISLDNKGYVVVDEYENTTEKNVCALGDATTSGYELTPVAIAAGRRLADRLFGGEPRARIEYKDVATVVFSHPPIGTVGLTEPEARQKFGDANVAVKQSAFGSMLFAFNDPDHKVKTGLKLVTVLPTETVVGLHCIGPFSDEMLQGFAIAVRMGATRRDFEASVAIHPTIAEEFVTFGGWGQKKTTDGTLKPWLAPYLDPKPWSSKTLFALGSLAGAAATTALFLLKSLKST
ncbi:hypothetical protein CTAYLR_003628 [Chrysophaeum taylorii]|uniref:Glutathione-disulfide reductase n=1 Tax=Chrysophaeum taylorii TaxID=2483200 RepID=A0AAD7XL72_9STRA|nr:hypothetical protein CTAYLR_003628 [Chrysophaeum taylorii]